MSPLSPTDWRPCSRVWNSTHRHCVCCLWSGFFLVPLSSFLFQLDCFSFLVCVWSARAPSLLEPCWRAPRPCFPSCSSADWFLAWGTARWPVNFSSAHFVTNVSDHRARKFSNDCNNNQDFLVFSSQIVLQIYLNFITWPSLILAGRNFSQSNSHVNISCLICSTS